MIQNAVCCTSAVPSKNAVSGNINHSRPLKHPISGQSTDCGKRYIMLDMVDAVL